jgi:hypothetical protein
VRATDAKPVRDPARAENATTLAACFASIRSRPAFASAGRTSSRSCLKIIGGEFPDSSATWATFFTSASR